MRTVVRSAAGRRAGFTLVEVLIAAALCLLIMTVMATAFQAGLDTLSQLKSLGDLQTRLRTAEVVLRRDLQADHLEAASGRNRVSDQRLDLWVPPGQPLPPGQFPPPPAWEPAERGFFRIIQEPVDDPTDPMQTQRAAGRVTLLEGTDPDGLPATRATGHILHMAVKLPADRTDKIFDADLPGAAGSGALVQQSLGLPRLQNGAGFRSQWAEVAYFLDTTNPTLATTANGNGRNLYTYPLVRRVRLLTEPRVPGSPIVHWQSVVIPPPGTFPVNQPVGQGFSYSPLPIPVPAYVDGRTGNPVIPPMPPVAAFPLNDPADITNPHRRLGGVGGTSGPIAPPTPGASPNRSGRYNLGFQHTGTLYTPHLLPPAALSPADVLAAEQTILRAPPDTSTPRPTAGGDVLMLNVISFEVRVNYDVNLNTDLRYNLLLDPTSGAPLPPNQQTGFTPLGQMTNYTPVPGTTCTIPLGLPGSAPGHSGFPDGAFDDLPPSTLSQALTPAGTPPTNGVGNPLFHRLGEAPALVKSRVFDLWGTNLTQVAPGSVAPWHAPVMFGLDPMTGAPIVSPQANPNFVPLPIRVKAIQIKLRAYDPKNKVSRQITIVESL